MDPLIEVPGEVREPPPPAEAPAPPKSKKAAVPAPLYTRGADGRIYMRQADAEEYFAKHRELPEDAKQVHTEQGRFLNPRKYNFKGAE